MFLGLNAPISGTEFMVRHDLESSSIKCAAFPQVRFLTTESH